MRCPKHWVVGYNNYMAHLIHCIHQHVEPPMHSLWLETYLYVSLAVYPFSMILSITGLTVQLTMSVYDNSMV